MIAIMMHFLQEDLLRERETRRLRYGYEIDFPEYKPPFQKNIDTRVKELEKQDSWPLFNFFQTVDV